MGEVTMIGLDLAKHVFQVHGVDASGALVLRKQLRRGQVVAFLWRTPPARPCSARQRRNRPANQPHPVACSTAAGPGKPPRTCGCALRSTFLEWLRVDIEIGKEFASIQVAAPIHCRCVATTRDDGAICL